MKTKLLYLLSFAAALTLTGCGLFSPCDGYDPVPISPIKLYFTDSHGVNLVQDEQSPYHPDSVKAKVEGPPFNLNFYRMYDQEKGGFVFHAYPSREKSGTTVLLIRLSPADTDTLVVSYLVDKNKCYTSVEYTETFYNGKLVYPESGTLYLQIVK